MGNGNGHGRSFQVGHDRAIGRANNLDFTAMANFVEFYICMLSFVNFRLYKSLGLFYPPQLQKNISQENEFDFKKPTAELDDRVYSLAFPIMKTEKTEPEMTIDMISESDNQEEDLAEKMRQLETLKMLFAKFKFYLSREVPKEPLAFIIRSCGGFVCWDDCSPNSLTETSELITHQVVDRNVQKMDINRVYVQPQWVFDCFNARRLLPTVKYAPTAMLPPHLSPFVEEQSVGEYLAAENIEQLNKGGNGLAGLINYNKNNGKNDGEKKATKKMTNEEKGMRVRKARVHKESQQKKINEEGHNLKLREMMIAKKHKRVYEKMKKRTKNKAREANKLKEKRARLDVEMKNSE